MTETKRKPPKLYRGVVASKSGDKTVKVLLNYLTRHPKYGKLLKRRTVAHVHDDANKAREGDTVDICKCRKMSKTKSWRLVRVIEEV
ncbi:MAG: 30S ribosomal protein S17 [Sedimentisphaerales bacterium]|nr:30S ribosomal protein S17 [Sedimentisphaerales bacterium]